MVDVKTEVDIEDCKWVC